jgi:hypothetical protein
MGTYNTEGLINVAALAAAYGMPAANVEPFLAHLGALSIVNDPNVDPMSEAGVQSRVRLEASKKGIHLWRNNLGAGKVVLEDGGGSRFMRWGLANDSKALNGAIKSADLIGIRRTLITQAMVGTHVGVFTSRECKEAKWKPSGSLREAAQIQWANLINTQGGDAKIVSGPGSFD